MKLSEVRDEGTIQYQPTLRDYLVASIRRHLYSKKSAVACALLVLIWILVTPPISTAPPIALLIVGVYVALLGTAAVMTIILLGALHWRTNPNLNCKEIHWKIDVATFGGEAMTREYRVSEVTVRPFLGRMLISTPDQYVYPVPNRILTENT